jgi:hypothetical protein
LNARCSEKKGSIRGSIRSHSLHNSSRQELTLAGADYECDTHKLAKKMTVEDSDDRDLSEAFLA